PPPPLQGWGGASSRPGVRGIVQPTIRPLFDTQAFGDVLLDTARAMGDSVGAKLPQGSFRGVVEASWGGDLAGVLVRGGSFGSVPLRGGSVLAGAAKLAF